MANAIGSRGIPVPRPLSEIEEVAIPKTDGNGVIRLLAIFMVHHVRLIVGMVPWLGFLLLKYPGKVTAVLAAYWGVLRKFEWFNRLVCQAVIYGCSDGPRFMRAQREVYSVEGGRKLMICVHPHGILLDPWFNLVARGTRLGSDSSNCSADGTMDLLDGLKVEFCFAPAVAWYPLHGETRKYHAPATPSAIRGVWKRGRTPVLCPGGFSEAVYTGTAGRYEHSYLHQRMGFIKLAIEQNADIVPTYTFGSDAMYWTWDVGRHGRAIRAQKIGVPMVVWSGKMGTNVPLSEETVTVSFDPFPTSKYTLEEVAEAHADYLTYLRTCFDTYKGCCEHTKDKELVFVGKSKPPAGYARL